MDKILLYTVGLYAFIEKLEELIIKQKRMLCTTFKIN
jgi:hypothetical protein